jgi:hypothetical protein
MLSYVGYWHKTSGWNPLVIGPFLIDGGPMWFSEMVEWLA